MSVGFIGMGTMGQMLVAALARSGVIAPDEIVVSNRSRERLDLITRRVPGVQVAVTNREVARRCDYIFLCVKPGETGAVLQETDPYITPDHLLVILNNTITIAMLEERTPARVAKVIPSVVQTVGKGASLLMVGDRCTVADRALLTRLMGAISHPHPIPESGARVASNLTSCGPAFVAYTLRALAEAARRYAPELGRASIDAMIRETVTATCALMEQTGYGFDEIIDRVSTPGGITAEGIHVMDELFAGLWEQVIETTIHRENAKRSKVEL